MNPKDAEKRVLTDLHDILKRWKEYGETMYHDDDNPNDDNDAHEQVLLPEIEEPAQKQSDQGGRAPGRAAENR